MTFTDHAEFPCCGCGAPVALKPAHAPGVQTKWCSATCRVREWERARYSPCAACGDRTKVGTLCRYCTAVEASAVQCVYTPEGVQVPLRDKAGQVVAWTIVDLEDAPDVVGHLWSLTKAGYANRRARAAEGTGRRIVLLHRHLLHLEHGDRRQGDHVNGDRLDNRRSNLRVVTAAQNAQNITSQRGASRYRGVSRSRRAGGWAATVRHAGQIHHLGTFDVEEDAAAAAAAKRAELFTHVNEQRAGHWPPVLAHDSDQALDSLTDAIACGLHDPHGIGPVRGCSRIALHVLSTVACSPATTAPGDQSSSLVVGCQTLQRQSDEGRSAA